MRLRNKPNLPVSAWTLYFAGLNLAGIDYGKLPAWSVGMGRCVPWPCAVRRQGFGTKSCLNGFVTLTQLSEIC